MYFPLYVDLSERNILVVGGGVVGTRRARVLSEFAGQITVVSPQVTEEMRELASLDCITLLQRPFEERDLAGMDVVLAATNDAVLNQKIAEMCRELGIPVNVSSDRTACDFLFPSVVADGNLVIGINASGEDHRKVKETRQKLEDMITGMDIYQ